MQDFDGGCIKFIKYIYLFKDDIFYLKLRYIFCFAEKETIDCKDGINSVKSSLNSYPFRLISTYITFCKSYNEYIQLNPKY